jgi:hypothetical protein
MMEILAKFNMNLMRKRINVKFIKIYHPKLFNTNKLIVIQMKMKIKFIHTFYHGIILMDINHNFFIIMFENMIMF